MVTDTEIPPTRVRSGQGGAITFIDFGDDAVVIWNDGDAMVDSQSLPVIKTMRFKN
jgi:selenophosphate synthetase-related protein